MEIKSVLKLSKNYILSTIVMFVVVYFTGIIIKLDGVILIIIKIIEGCIIYAVMLFILKDEFCYQIKDKVFEKIHNIRGKKI